MTAPIVPSQIYLRDLPIYIDSSMLSTYRSCRRKFLWSYIEKLAPTGQSIHLAAGGAFAAGLEAARNHQFISSPDKALPLDDLLHAAIGPYLRAWDNYEPDSEETKNHHNVFHALEEYLTQFHPFTDIVQPTILNGKPATEFTFAIPLPIMHPVHKTPFVYVGRFDMLGTFSGLPVVLDEKTTSALGTYWMQQWDLRGQFIGYVWACQQLGYKIDHVIVRGIAIQKTQHQFATVPVQYPQHLIDTWYRELLNTLHELLIYTELGNFSYNFGDSCAAYGGCGYKTLCTAENWTEWTNNYSRNEWKPISVDNAA